MDDSNKILAKEWFNAAISDFQYAEVGLKEEQIFPQEEIILAFESARQIKEAVEKII